MRILVAQQIDPAGVERARELGAVLDIRDPIRPGARLSDLDDVAVLFADHCPVNVEDLGTLRWIQLGSAGYQQLAGLPLAQRSG